MTTINTASNLSRLTLKSFKTVRWMSEETICFTATVVLDGKVIGTASNEGHGGSTFVHYISDIAKADALAFAKSISPADVKGWEFLADSGFDFDNLVDIAVERKDSEAQTKKLVAKVRRDAVKKVMFLKTTTPKRAYHQFKNVTEANAAAAIMSAKATPDFKCLVTSMTDEEIIEWFIA